MENVIVNGNTVSLATLRTGVAEGEQRAYGARRDYAKGLNAAFTFDWFEVEHTDTSEEAKTVHAEKKALFAELKRIARTPAQYGQTFANMAKRKSTPHHKPLRVKVQRVKVQRVKAKAQVHATRALCCAILTTCVNCISSTAVKLNCPKKWQALRFTLSRHWRPSMLICP